MNYKHLYYFWWVAKAGGVVKAGEQLHITPHTISGQIGLLEDDLGTPLYAEGGRNIELTDAGKLAFGYAQESSRLAPKADNSFATKPDISIYFRHPNDTRTPTTPQRRQQPV